MKVAKLDGAPFVTALRSLIGTVLAGHPDAERVLDAVTSGALRVRVVADQTEDHVAIGGIDAHGEYHVIASIDAATWVVVYPDLFPAPTPVH